MTRVTLLISRDKTEALVLTRGESNGMDIPTTKILSYEDDVLVLRVRGHKESSGYDRLQGGTLYSYIPAATRSFRVVERYPEDRYSFGREHIVVEELGAPRTVELHAEQISVLQRLIGWTLDDAHEQDALGYDVLVERFDTDEEALLVIARALDGEETK